MVCGNLWMMWRASHVNDITPASLALLNLIRPVPDLLILGTGSSRTLPPRETLQMLHDLGIGLESLPTVRVPLFC
jgi:uncharacterized protein